MSRDGGAGVADGSGRRRGATIARELRATVNCGEVARGVLFGELVAARVVRTGRVAIVDGGLPG